VKEENYFTLEEIENILVSIIKCLQYLEDKKIGHGCISLLDIGISENGRIKLFDPVLASNSPFSLKQGYHYSPELYENNIELLNGGSINSNLDMLQNDVYVLGILIL